MIRLKKTSIRRLTALVLSIVMLLSLGTAAFAAGPGGGSAAIYLYDSDGGAPLSVPGAVYALYLYTGTTFDEWANFTTEEFYGEYVGDEKGVVIAKNLPAGEYRWELVKAPDGYNVTPLIPNYLPIGPGAEASTNIFCFKTTFPEEFTTQRIAYVGGYPDGTVRPKDNITRAEAAVILHRLLSDEVKEKYASSENTFSDLKDGAWYMNAIATLKNMGVIVQNGPYFEPSRPITRGEFAEWIYFFGGQTFLWGIEFTDEPGGVPIQIYQRWLKYKTVAMHGWVQGYPDGSFKPEGLITRAEMMTVFNRMLERLPATAGDLPENSKSWSDNANPAAWYYLAVQEATAGIPLD